MSELLPCPFCGGEADTMTPEADDMRAATVMCTGCYCTGKECETEAQAISAWNRRATPARDDDLRAAAKWHRTTNGLPKKPGKKDYEQIECLIMLPNGEIEISMWNCEHEVWDDAEGDDYRHDPCKPTHWMPLGPIRAALSAPAQEGSGK